MYIYFMRHDSIFSDMAGDTDKPLFSGNNGCKMYKVVYKNGKFKCEAKYEIDPIRISLTEHGRNDATRK